MSRVHTAEVMPFVPSKEEMVCSRHKLQLREMAMGQVSFARRLEEERLLLELALKRIARGINSETLQDDLCQVLRIARSCGLTQLEHVTALAMEVREEARGVELAATVARLLRLGPLALISLCGGVR